MLSIHIEVTGASNLEQKKLWWTENGKNNWKCRYLAPWDHSYNNTIVIAIVSRPEFLLFKAWCRIAFGEAITSEHHEIFKPAFKLGYSNIWRVYSFKNIQEISSRFLSWYRFIKVGKIYKKIPTSFFCHFCLLSLIGSRK